MHDGEGWTFTIWAMGSWVPLHPPRLDKPREGSITPKHGSGYSRQALGGRGAPLLRHILGSGSPHDSHIPRKRQ